MIVTIDNPMVQKARNGRVYVSFWARFLFGTEYLSVSGFKFFPDTKVISTPTQSKGEGKFVNLTKMSTGTYNAILDAAINSIGNWNIDEMVRESETAA